VAIEGGEFQAVVATDRREGLRVSHTTFELTNSPSRPQKSLSSTSEKATGHAVAGSPYDHAATYMTVSESTAVTAFFRWTSVSVPFVNVLNRKPFLIASVMVLAKGWLYRWVSTSRYRSIGLR